MTDTRSDSSEHGSGSGPGRTADPATDPGAVPAGRPGALMVAELDVRDIGAMAEYGREVIPMLARWGGEVLGVAPPNAPVEEGEPTERMLIVHSWPSAERFREFLRCEEYQPIRAVRHAAADSRLTAFDTLAAGWRPG